MEKEKLIKMLKTLSTKALETLKNKIDDLLNSSDDIKKTNM